MIPKVSVSIITYNHEHFIRQAIESVLMQKINFAIDIIIADDFSSDGTRGILIEYQNKYPEIIKLILHSQKNAGLPGVANFVSSIYLAQGEYIALLDGDDYWTDPNKLQKQINYLENHPDYSICFHWADWLEDGKINKRILGPPKIKEYYTEEDLLEYRTFIPTSSVVFRRRLNKFPDWFYQSTYNDFILYILNARRGKIGFINKSMAVYRKHAGGIYGRQTNIYNLKRSINCYKLVGRNLKYQNNNCFRKGLAKIYYELSGEYLNSKNRKMAKKMMAKGINIHPSKIYYAIKGFFLLYVPIVLIVYNVFRKVLSNFKRIIIKYLKLNSI